MFDRSDEFRGKISYFWPLTPDKKQRVIFPIPWKFLSTISWTKTSVAWTVQWYLNIMMKIDWIRLRFDFHFCISSKQPPWPTGYPWTIWFKDIIVILKFCQFFFQCHGLRIPWSFSTKKVRIWTKILNLDKISKWLGYP